MNPGCRTSELCCTECTGALPTRSICSCPQLKEENHRQEEQLHCDATRCKATPYKTCRGGDLCGTINGIPNGLQNTGCAEGAFSPVQGLNNEQTDENWVKLYDSKDVSEIAGVEISGGYSARIQEYGPEFSEVLHPGFTALKGKEELYDYDYGDGDTGTTTIYMRNAQRINLFCP